MTETAPTLTAELYADVEVLWDYHQMHHELHPTDVGIGLGSHDLGVATQVAELYHRGMFPTLVFAGATSPTTTDRFPCGEAVHYHEHAVSLGVPDEAIRVEPQASNTGENIRFTRDLLADAGYDITSVTLISRPYQQRRAYATCQKLWPEVRVQCSSQALPLPRYIDSIGDTTRVVDMLVGDTQRLWVYAERGFAIHQDIPVRVVDAFNRLIRAGSTSRLITD